MQITSDRRTYKMVGMAKDNFPAVPAFPHALVKIPAKILSSLIAKTAFAISMEESRYTLNGALLILKPDTIAMVATDGHRLAVAEADHTFTGLSNEARTLVPKKAMTEIQRLAGETGDESEIEFARDDSHLFFQSGRNLLISRILTGQFPNYEAVLPRDNHKTVVLERGEFNDAVRRVSQLADQRSHAVKFSVNQEGVELSASSPEYGEARETIEKEYKGEPIAIGLTGNICSIFWAPRPTAPSASSSRTNSPRGKSARSPMNSTAIATSSCPCASKGRPPSTAPIF